MGFAEILDTFDLSSLSEQLEMRWGDDVERALAHESVNDDDLLSLLSPAAGPYLEPLARRAQTVTQQRFGRTIQLYAPVYLSNECVNRCAYCGFSHELTIRRATLTPEQVVAEADVLRDHGFRHLLLVSGEAPRTTGASYVEQMVVALRPRFDSISIETGTFDRQGYERIVSAGADGLTLYQETYQPDVYRRVHRAGPKARHDLRLAAIEAGAEAGFRSLGLGALLGLAPFRLEAYLLAMHGRYLARRFWRCRIALSFPRIRSTAGGFVPPHPVSDADLVQMICTLRLALPDAELVLSTREPPQLRNALLGLGITRISAGSRTNPGAYSHRSDTGEQFEVEDSRSPSEVAEAIVSRGFEPVWKDFDRAFAGPPAGVAA